MNIDLNDEAVCSVCKLETHAETLSFCHVCFELSIEGVSAAALLHTRSLRGHRDCFEKYHLIANQKLSRSAASRGTYEGVKLALGQKLSRIIRYAQNKDPDPTGAAGAGAARRGAGKHHCHGQQSERKAAPRADTQVPRYAPRWDSGGMTAGLLECHASQELELRQEARRGPRSLRGPCSVGDPGENGHRGLGREELTKMSTEELHQLNTRLLLQVQMVFEQLSSAVQEKDSLASELHVRHVAIEQLFKNCSKVPWLHISRAGGGAGSAPPVE